MNELRVNDIATPFTAVNSETKLQTAGRHVFSFVRVRCSAFTSNTSGKVTITASDHSIGVQITGTFTATLQFEATIDGVTWFAALLTPVAGGAAVSSASAAGAWTHTY